MEFRQVHFFLAASRHISFTKAAEAVGVTQPAMTIAIKKLEAELGGKLFYRRGRNVELTPLGKAVYDQFVLILEVRDSITKTAAEFTTSELVTDTNNGEAEKTV